MEAGPRRQALGAALVVLAWVLVALAWTPPTVAVQRMMPGSFGRASAAVVFLYVLLGFVPWMAATPLLLHLGRRFAVSERRIVRPILIHALIGLAVVPLATLAGTTLGAFFIQNFSIRPSDAPRLLNAAAITSFYSIPTYVAVVAIGQALAYFERYRARERLLARAELRVLEAQLNPHFLFNALNAISALGYRDPALADKALALLSAMLRSTLKERPQFVALKDEIALLENYLELYALLVPGRLDQAYVVEPEVWNAAVPAMLLQPLAENALVHGIAKLVEGGRLVLTAGRKEDRFCLVLHNPAPRDLSPSRGNGIGLANVRERLRVLFGEHASVAFERSDTEAKVTVEFPFREMSA